MWSTNDSVLFPSQFPPVTGDGMILAYEGYEGSFDQAEPLLPHHKARVHERHIRLESMVGPAEVTRLALSSHLDELLLPFLALTLSPCLLTLFFVPFSDALKVPSCSHVINPPSA